MKQAGPLLRTTLACLFALVLSLSVPLQAEESSIVADASINQGFFDNIAGSINFWGRKEAQERFIEELGAGLYRVKIRLHRVKKQGNCYTNFPWEGDDLSPVDMTTLVRNLNSARAKGCRIILQMYGIPKWLSTSQDESIVTNNLPNYAKYPPKDFYEWAKVVFAAVHALKGAGLSRIDYCEVFGEPNCGSTWYQQMMPCIEDGEVVYNCEPNELGHNTLQIMNNFLRVYKYTAMGVKAAEPNVVVGSPAIVPNISGIWWTRFLLRYFAVYGLPVGFYSWHWYGVDEVLSSTLDKIRPYEPLSEAVVRQAYEEDLQNQGFSPAQVRVFLYDIYDYLKDLEQWGEQAVRLPYSFVSSNLRRIMAEEGFDSQGLLLTEWNVHHRPDRRHDTHYGASFIARGLIDITNSGTGAQNYYSLACRPYYDDNGYGGFWSLFTLDGSNIPKASFNAFKLFSMLGHDAERIYVEVSDDDIYAIATEDENEISLLATYYIMAQDPENPDYGLNKPVALRVEDIPFSAYTYSVYLIDGNHSNSYYGSGPDLEIVESGVGQGDLEKAIDLSIYGVVMVKIEEVP